MSESKNHKPRLVQDTAEKLRELIFDREPDTHLGSLNEVAELLGVGIVTVQQAARILEHEGLLAVKRGPGGGYYGTRPDDSALERAFATYLRVHNFGYREAFEMTVLLDCDIIQAAAGAPAADIRDKIDPLADQLERCQSAQDRIDFEVDFREALFVIVERPLLELVARVSMQLYKAKSNPVIFADSVGLTEWKRGRERILYAIRQRDQELAYFEAQRFRHMVLNWTGSQDPLPQGST